MTIEQKIARVVAAIPALMTEVAEMLGEDFPAYIEAEMTQSKIAAATFNTSDKLHSNTPVGGLADSFRPDAEDSGTKISVSARGISGEFGSKKPYALIHNTGGFIASKGNMHKFFWAKYAKTKTPFYKIIALSVMKKGGVNIRKRAYFDNAVKEFNDKAIPQITANILLRARQIFEAQQ